MRVSLFCCGFPHFRFRNQKSSSFIHNERIRRHRPCELSKPVAVLWSGYPAALVGDVYECIGKRLHVAGTKKQKSDLSHTAFLPHLHDLVYMYPARRRACLVRSLARRCHITCQDGAARQWRRCLRDRHWDARHCMYSKANSNKCSKAISNKTGEDRSRLAHGGRGAASKHRCVDPERVYWSPRGTSGSA